MLLSQGRNTNHMPFHSLPQLLLRQVQFFMCGLLTRTVTATGQKALSGQRGAVAFSQSHICQLLLCCRHSAQRAQLAAIGSKESRAGWSGPSRGSSPCGHNYCGCFSCAWRDSSAFKPAIPFCFRAAFPSFCEWGWCRGSSFCRIAFPVYSLQAGRDFVLGTSHTQIKPKWGGQAKKNAQGKTLVCQQPKIENHPIN